MCLSEPTTNELELMAVESELMMGEPELMVGEL